MIPMTPVERFWSKVDTSGDCWTWTGANTRGYGMLTIAGRNHYAHRFSFAFHYGPFHRRLHVLHTCDNPSCVRPDHLWLGTAKDNARDCSAKGRNPMQGKDTCPQGHPYDRTVPSHGGIARACRQCSAAASRRYRASKVA